MLLEVLVFAVVALGAVVSLFAVGGGGPPSGWRDLVTRFGWRFLAVAAAALALPSGPRAMLVAWLVGATLGFLLDWLIGALLGPECRFGGRPGSMLARALGVRPGFAAGVSLAALGLVSSLRWVRDDTLAPPWLGPALLVLGLLLQLFAWVRGSRRADAILALARDARPVDALPPPRADRTVDVGVGDQTWLLDARQGTPYRQGPSASVLIFGHLFDGARAAAQAAGRRVPAILVTAGSLGAVLATPAPAPEPPSQKQAAFATAEVAKRSTTTRTNLTWYPQPAPIVRDLNGDGVEDVVGLRWDSAHEAAALRLVANDGKTFEELWRSPGFPAQWYGGSTFLIESGDDVFMTDGEGYLRVFEAKTGKMTAFADVPRSGSACALPDAHSVFLAAERWQDDGLTMDALGHRRETKRPDRCVSPGQEPRCPTMRGDACHSSWPKSLDGLVGAYGTAWEQGDVGAVIGQPAQRGASAAEADRSQHVWGFDPKTGKARYDVPVAFDERPLHANPSLETTFAGRRVFAYYQLKSGDWTVGARDGKTGEVAWHGAMPRAEMGTHFQSMSATDTRLYVSLDHRLEVFDAATGATLGVIW
jgi:hypothetical protein